MKREMVVDKALYGTCQIKFLFDACTYARFHFNGTHIPVPIVLPYPYAWEACTSRHCKYTCSQSTPIFVKRRISTRRCELFSMYNRRVILAFGVFACTCLAVAFLECSFIAACAFSVSRWFIQTT